MSWVQAPGSTVEGRKEPTSESYPLVSTSTLIMAHLAHIYVHHARTNSHIVINILNGIKNNAPPGMCVEVEEL